MSPQDEAHATEVAAMQAEAADLFGTARALYLIARDMWRKICDERGEAIIAGVDQGPLDVMRVVERAGWCAAGAARTGVAES
jgi:hypothetical protein